VWNADISFASARSGTNKEITKNIIEKILNIHPHLA
jgi:hypothetical protein